MQLCHSPVLRRWENQRMLSRFTDYFYRVSAQQSVAEFFFTDCRIHLFSSLAARVFNKLTYLITYWYCYGNCVRLSVRLSCAEIVL